MECYSVSPTELPGTTRLYSALLSDFPAVSEFYSHPPNATGIDQAIQEVQLGESTRQSVAEVLTAQNREFGGDEATRGNLDRLRNGAFAVVTGQQVGLFGGPAFSIYKALTAIRVAGELTARGVDAVPIFWLATEDHDLAEVDHTFLPKRGGLDRVELPVSGLADRRVGDIGLGEPIRELVGRVTSVLEGPFAQEVAEWLTQSYAPEETFGTAFAKLMTSVLAGRGLIFLDPLSPALHRLALPTLIRAVKDHKALTSELTARSEALERAGFHAQVKVTERSTLLFRIVEGQRLALRQSNGGLTAGSKSESLEETLAALETYPDEFGPNALLRPVMQDTLLPTVAYIAGPAEAAYHAQTSLLYKRLLGRAPAILPRASFTIVPAHVLNLLRKYGLTVLNVIQARHALRTRMEAEALPQALSARFEQGEQAIKTLVEALREPLARLDQTLIGALDNVSEKMLYQLNGLRTKAGRAEGFRTGVLNTHENEIANWLFPNNALQERSFGLLTFLAGEGRGLLDCLESHIKSGGGEHSFLLLQPPAR